MNERRLDALRKLLPDRDWSVCGGPNDERGEFICSVDPKRDARYEYWSCDPKDSDAICGEIERALLAKDGVFRVDCSMITPDGCRVEVFIAPPKEPVPPGRGLTKLDAFLDLLEKIQ